MGHKLKKEVADEASAIILAAATEEEPCVNCLLGHTGNTVAIVLIEGVHPSQWTEALKEIVEHAFEVLEAYRKMKYEESLGTEH